VYVVHGDQGVDLIDEMLFLFGGDAWEWDFFEDYVFVVGGAAGEEEVGVDLGERGVGLGEHSLNF